MRSYCIRCTHIHCVQCNWVALWFECPRHDSRGFNEYVSMRIFPTYFFRHDVHVWGPVSGVSLVIHTDSSFARCVRPATALFAHVSTASIRATTASRVLTFPCTAPTHMANISGQLHRVYYILVSCHSLYQSLSISPFITRCALDSVLRQQTSGRTNTGATQKPRRRSMQFNTLAQPNTHPFKLH